MNFDSLIADLESETAPAPIGPSLSVEQAAALAGSLAHSATVSAGAGAGKTRLLIERVVRLIKAGADPSAIAVVTFTRKAAKEIQERLLARFGSSKRLPVCSTVHALALARLQAQGRPVLLAPDAVVHGFVDGLRSAMPEEFQSMTSEELLLELGRCREEQDFESPLGAAAQELERRLDEAGWLDFTALVSLAAAHARPQFKHILVDESQDLSKLQRALLRRLGKPSCRYWYIGDDDQGIYAFRGAGNGVMQELAQECEEHHVLSVNYRSTQAVVAHANNVIQMNPGRTPIAWKAARAEQGLVTVEHFASAADELTAVEAWLRADDKRVALARTTAVIAPLKQMGLRAHTVHESKGLEWPEVWIMGCEAALFPHPLGKREEERRLFYVAMTRARDNLCMSYCSSRSAKNPQAGGRHPSPFLFETQAFET